MHAVGEALIAEADRLGIELIPLDPARVVATELEQVKGLIARKVDLIVGIDGLKAGLDAVADGTLTATLFQDAIGQGTQAMIVASKFLAGERVAPRLLFPFKLVTKENVASFR
jgi:ABC-type sugar transport system substrate-binding protein